MQLIRSLFVISHAVVMAALLFGFPCLGEEVIDRAVLLDGSNFVRTTKWSKDLFPNRSFTFQLWLRASQPGVIISETEISNVSSWEIAFAEVFAGGVVKVGVPGIEAFTAGVIEFGQWNHLTLVYDDAAQTLKPYLNGKAGEGRSGKRRVPEDNQRTAVYPFGRGGPGNLGGGSWLAGELDEVRIWNRALNSEEAISNWREPLEGTEPGLAGYWKFDSTAGNLSPDSSFKDNVALHVPVDRATPLVLASTPIFGGSKVVTLDVIKTVSGTVLRGLAETSERALEVYFQWGSGEALTNETVSELIPQLGRVRFSILIGEIGDGEFRFRAVGRQGGELVYGEVKSFDPKYNAKSAAELNGNDFFRGSILATESRFNESFTYEFWFYPETAGVLTGETSSDGSSSRDTALAELLSDGTLRAGLPGLNSIQVGTVELRKWHHFALTYDDTNQRLAAYLNGKFAGESMGDRTRAPSEPAHVYQTFGLGGPRNLGPGGNFSGKFDEVRIWKVPLPSETLGQQWNKLVMSSHSSIKALWRFDQSAGNLVFDSGGGTNHAIYVPVGQAFPLVPSTAPILFQPETVVTLPAAVTLERATLAGQIVPDGIPLKVRFEWGSTPQLGQATPLREISANRYQVTFSESLEGIPPAEYFYRAVAQLPDTTLYGQVRTFTKVLRSGKAVSLDSGIQFFRTRLTTAEMFDSEDFTIEFWFNPVTPGVILGEFDSLDHKFWEYPYAQLDDATLKVGLPGGGVHSIGPVEYGRWHHLALGYDQGAQHFRAFLNGQRRLEVTTGRLLPEQFGRLARLAFGLGTASKPGFRGQVDEVRIWRHSPEDYEVAQGFNKTTSAREGLVGYWSFDGIGGDHILDLSHFANDGIISIGTNSPSLKVNLLELNEDKRPIITRVWGDNLNVDLLELRANINPNGASTAYSIHFGAESDSLREIKRGTISTLIAVETVSAELRQLPINKEHYFRISASNEYGNVSGPLIRVLKTGWSGAAAIVAGGASLFTVRSQSEFLPTDDFTLEFWFRAEHSGVMAGEFSPANRAYLDRSMIEILSSGMVVFGVEGLSPVAGGVVTFGEWHHAALRYTANTRRLSAFIDGNKTGADSFGSRLSPVDRPFSTVFSFGEATATHFGSGGSFSGSYDDIRWWSVARTDKEIAGKFNNILNGDEPGLVAYWPLGNTNAAGLMADFSGNGNDGAVVGMVKVAWSDAPLTYSLIEAQRVGDALKFEFLRSRDVNYALESSVDFSRWIPVSTNTASVHGLLRFQQAWDSASPYRFYRVKPLEE